MWWDNRNRRKTGCRCWRTVFSIWNLIWWYYEKSKNYGHENGPLRWFNRKIRKSPWTPVWYADRTDFHRRRLEKTGRFLRKCLEHHLTLCDDAGIRRFRYLQRMDEKPQISHDLLQRRIQTCKFSAGGTGRGGVTWTAVISATVYFQNGSRPWLVYNKASERRL